jgi:RNA-splicing ligase RtcB
MRSIRGEDDYYTKAHRREEKAGTGVKFGQALLEGELFSEYMHDIAIVQQFAELNRRAIADTICAGLGLEIKDRFSCKHNYIDEKSMILRKGAISARLGERVIIPLNMRDGAILGYGLGNADWNFSAPHGAGRVCSRSDAAHAYTVEQFKAEMAGIYTTTAEKGSLDECPMAYKPPERILEFLHETVKVEEIIKPVYNFKSC